MEELYTKLVDAIEIRDAIDKKARRAEAEVEDIEWATLSEKKNKLKQSFDEKVEALNKKYTIDEGRRITNYKDYDHEYRMLEREFNENVRKVEWGVTENSAKVYYNFEGLRDANRVVDDLQAQVVNMRIAEEEELRNQMADIKKKLSVIADKYSWFNSILDERWYDPWDS